MKIKLEHFGQHELLELDTRATETVLFVVGKNRVGKSTIRDAIEFALLGSCQIRGFKLKKDIATYMIQDGQSWAMVTLSMGSWSVRRSVTRGGSSKIEIAGVGEEWTEVNATQWHERFHVEADAVRVALDAEQFYRMDDKARRKLLISVKDSEGIDGGDIWSALGTALTSYADEEPARQGKLRGICGTIATLGFAKGNAIAVENRKMSKRDAASLEEQIRAIGEPPHEVDGIDITAGELSAHEAKLAKAREELLHIQERRAASGGQVSGRMLERVEQKAQAQAAVVRAEAQGVGMELDGENRTFTLEELNALFKEIRGEHEKAKSGIERMTATIVTETGIRDSARSEVDSMTVLAKSPAQCPAVSFTMKCPVRPSTFATAFEKSGGLPDKFEAAKSMLEACESTLGKLGDLADTQANEMLALDARYDLVMNARIAAQDQRTDLDAAALRLAKIQEQIDDLQEQIDGVEEGPTEDDLEAARTLVIRGDSIVTARQLLEHQRDQERRLREMLSEVEVETMWWDEIEKQLRPDGIESALAGMATSRFAESLAACDSLAKVRITDAMDLTINGSHVLTRSKSEQLCGGIALQAAMSIQVGLPFLVIDEVDKLDAFWKRTFQVWASDERKTFQAGITALATSDADPPGVPPDGFVTAWVRKDERTLLLGGGFDW